MGLATRQLSCRAAYYCKVLGDVMLYPGFGVPYLNTFFWYLFLKGARRKKSLYFFLPGYFKVQLFC